MNIRQSEFQKPFLIDKGVHIWCFSLPIEKDILIKLEESLSPSEIKKMNQFYFQKDRDRFLAARGGTRVILSRYLMVKPNEIPFSYTEYGKPFILQSKINFNLSHSHNKIVLAICKDYSIGIDIEFCNRDLDFLPIAEQVFTVNEYHKLLEFEFPHDVLAFYRCWTRKEAVLKALGKGFHHPVKELEVGCLPRFNDIVKTIDNKSTIDFINIMEESIWYLNEIMVSPEYLCSLAIPFKQKNVQFYEWKF